MQFGSPLSLLPVWNPGWGNNLQEWGVAIVGKPGAPAFDFVFPLMNHNEGSIKGDVKSKQFS